MSDAHAIHADLIARQLAWAETVEIDVDGEARVRDWDRNLLAPPSEPTRTELARLATDGRGADGKSGPLHGLGSGLALAANVFDPWRDRPEALAEWATVLGPAPRALEFAAPLTPAAAHAACSAPIDVLLDQGPDGATAVCALFTEPFTDVDPRIPGSAPGEDDPLWRALPGCALLARDLRANPRRYRRVAAGRILDVALGMTRRFGRHGFRLAVLWYDAGGRASRRLRAELDRLRMRIGGEVDLVTTSWQGLLAPLRATPTADGPYTRRLEARYFAPAPGAEDDGRDAPGRRA